MALLSERIDGASILRTQGRAECCEKKSRGGSLYFGLDYRSVAFQRKPDAELSVTGL
jgi:hypothetical protein